MSYKSSKLDFLSFSIPWVCGYRRVSFVFCLIKSLVVRCLFLAVRSLVFGLPFLGSRKSAVSVKFLTTVSFFFGFLAVPWVFFQRFCFWVILGGSVLG
jgi:hypothetical protein